MKAIKKSFNDVSIPTGNTQFNFKDADLNLHSISYDWLIIANHKIMYKGFGKINGEGNYGFFLSSIDGQLNDEGGDDKFRIKIWIILVAVV